MNDGYPVEMRERVVQAYEAGEGSYPEIAARFAVGEASVKRWVWRVRAHGDLASRPKRGGNYSAITRTVVEALVTRLGDATANELTVEFNRTRRGAARVHVSSMKRALHRSGYVVKKNAAGRWRVSARTS